MFFFHEQKTTFFSFVFVKNLFFFTKPRLSLCFALELINVKKSTRAEESQSFSISSQRERARCSKNSEYYGAFFFITFVSLCVRTACCRPRREVLTYYSFSFLCCCSRATSFDLGRVFCDSRGFPIASSRAEERVSR